jgi:kynurenine formamidase
MTGSACTFSYVLPVHNQERVLEQSVRRLRDRLGQYPGSEILLVENGIHIIEVLDLEELAAAGVHEFLFICSPLKLVGATGSPVRPLALVDS